MERRDIEQLAIYEIKSEVEMIPLVELRHLYLEKTSEIIYIVKNKKLYGIVCLNEASNAHEGNLQVKINKSFTVLVGYNIVKAYRTFAAKGINKIPVVDEQVQLRNVKR